MSVASPSGRNPGESVAVLPPSLHLPNRLTIIRPDGRVHPDTHMAPTPIFPERIETDRLHLDRLSMENVDPFELYRVCSADDGIEQVTQYVPWSPHETVAETVEFVERCERAWEDRESATYLLRPRRGEDGAGEIAGATGLAIAWERKAATLGIWLRRQFWGRGYSGERAAALLEVAFERLDLEVVVVSLQVGNERSRRAVEKYVSTYGGRHEGLLRNVAVDDGGPIDQHRYTIAREEYRAAVER